MYANRMQTKSHADQIACEPYVPTAALLMHMPYGRFAFDLHKTLVTYDLHARNDTRMQIVCQPKSNVNRMQSIGVASDSCKTCARDAYDSHSIAAAVHRTE